MQGRLVSEEAQPQPTARRDSQAEEQLLHTQEKLRLKEREVKWRYHSAAVLQLIHRLHVLSDTKL